MTKTSQMIAAMLVGIVGAGLVYQYEPSVPGVEGDLQTYGVPLGTFLILFALAYYGAGKLRL